MEDAAKQAVKVCYQEESVTMSGSRREYLKYKVSYDVVVLPGTFLHLSAHIIQMVQNISELSFSELSFSELSLSGSAEPPASCDVLELFT